MSIKNLGLPHTVFQENSVQGELKLAPTAFCSAPSGGVKPLEGRVSGCKSERKVGYQGQSLNGIRHGQGTHWHVYVTGDLYVGAWVNGKRHGLGTCSYANGDNYAGIWENGKMHGWGTYKCFNGDSYEGVWKNGRPQGQGTFIYASGGSYVGAWENGLRHGQGLRIYADGDSWEGTWENDEPFGFGDMIMRRLSKLWSEIFGPKPQPKTIG